jgi:hypothetical protein
VARWTKPTTFTRKREEVVFVTLRTMEAGNVFLRHHLVGKPEEERNYLRKREFESSLYIYVKNDTVNHVDGLGLIEYRVQPITDPYTVPKCTIVIFTARHSDHMVPLLRDRLVVKKCGATCAVGCKASTLRPFLPALFPGCQLTSQDVVYYPSQAGLEPGQVDGDALIRDNITAAKAHALTLCKPECCCKSVKIDIRTVSGPDSFQVPGYPSETVPCP